jgi:hypothetical protein
MIFVLHSYAGIVIPYAPDGNPSEAGKSFRLSIKLANAFVEFASGTARITIDMMARIAKKTKGE